MFTTSTFYFIMSLVLHRLCNIGTFFRLVRLSVITNNYKNQPYYSIVSSQLNHWFNLLSSTGGCLCTRTERVFDGREGGPYKDSALPMKACTLSLTTESKNNLAMYEWLGLVKAKETAKSISQLFSQEPGLNFQTVFRCLNILTSPQTAVTRLGLRMVTWLV